MLQRVFCVGLGIGVVVSVGCKGEEPPDEEVLKPICEGTAAWAGEVPVFSEETESWGLTGVEGTRFVAVDFDGDGWTDLHVHRGGDWPDDFSAEGVRESWLLRNVGGQGFEDVTESSGFRALRVAQSGSLGRPGSVVVFGDVDNDGDLDAYVGLGDSDNTEEETSELLLNQGDGTFLLGRDDLALQRASEVPAGASFVDVDRDGALDLWVTQNAIDGQPLQDRLYRGDGAGGFEDATVSMGLQTDAWVDLNQLNGGKAHTVSWSAAACDLNNDGYPELLSSSYGRAPNHLWRGVDGGGFENASVSSGYAYDDRMDWTDNESARCYCTLHPTAADCEGVPAPIWIACDSEDDVFRWNHTYDREAFRLGGNSGATRCADVNNDGWMDLLTTEIVHWDVGSSSDPSELLVNGKEEGVRFERPGNDVTGLVREHDITAWNDGDITATVLDFDNDQWPDIYVGSTDYASTRGLLYRQVEAGRFEPVATELGIDHKRSHGVAVADFDRDGDLDMIVGHSRNRCSGECYDTPQVRLFENQLGGTFVQLSLEGGAGANKAAIGARVEVTAEGVTQTQEVGGGYGHYGAQDDLVLHFGIGAACEADVGIHWPDGQRTEQQFTLAAGYRYRVVQGAEPEVLLLP